MTQDVKRRIWAFLVCVAALLLLLTGAALGRSCSSDRDSDLSIAEQNEILRQQLESMRKSYDDVIVVNNDRVKSLQEVIDQQGDKMGELADIILKLRDKPVDVKYITNTVTIIDRQTSTVTVSVKDLPDEKLFGLPDSDGNLVVLDRMTARDENKDGTPDVVDFDSYDVTIEYDSAISDSTSGFLLRVKSSYDDVYHTFPVKASVTVIEDEEKGKKHKLIDPGLKMQLMGVIGATLREKDPVMGYAAGLSAPWLFPQKGLEILSPSISLGSTRHIGTGEDHISVRVGITAASYNVGWNERSIIKDTWIGIDAGVASDGGVTGGLTLGTRL
jgi:hypothetical protein